MFFNQNMIVSICVGHIRFFLLLWQREKRFQISGRYRDFPKGTEEVLIILYNIWKQIFRSRNHNKRKTEVRSSVDSHSFKIFVTKIGLVVRVNFLGERKIETNLSHWFAPSNLFDMTYKETLISFYNV